MKHKTFFAFVCVLLFAVILHAYSQPAKLRNVLLIVADDLGYGDIGCMGAKNFKTPNIDSLASNGIVFSQGYATASTCTPSRYSMLTGEYAWRQKDKP